MFWKKEIKKKLNSWLLKTVLVFFFAGLLGGLFSLGRSVSATDTVLPGNSNCTIKDCKKGASSADTCKQYCGKYELNDMVALVIHVSNLILSVVGALSLLAFVAGGVMFLLSAGNPSLVAKGKATLIGAVIGLLIVFFSYTAIKFLEKDVFKVKDDTMSAGMDVR